MNTQQPTCAERIADRLADRLADFAALNAAAAVHDPQGVRNVATDHHKTLQGLDALPSDDWSDEDGYTDRTADEFAEQARERIAEYPLGLSSQRVFRIDLSTGGPGDWLEVFCDGDTPNYEPEGDGEHYGVVRIVYHFADWYDHAERTLERDEFDTAERFASEIIPELIG